MIDTLTTTDSTLTYLRRVYAGFAVASPDGHGSRVLPRPARDHRYAPWAAAFDDIDLADFAEALRCALDAAAATRDTSALEATVDGWRALARIIAEPQREAIVLGWGSPAFHRFVDTASAEW
jgi:hypothetical protein